MITRLSCAAAAPLVLAACSGSTGAQEAFREDVLSLCGQAFEGRIVSTDKIDDAWRAERIVMHVRDCRLNEIRIPLHVGRNRSRTWVLSREQGQLALRHDHRRPDGSPDALTQYGGRAGRSTARRVEFPADADTKALFEAEQIPESMDNVWALEMNGGLDLFAYEMSREGRFFRIEFDLADPVDAPPPPWGAEDAAG